MLGMDDHIKNERPMRQSQCCIFQPVNVSLFSSCYFLVYLNKDTIVSIKLSTES